MSAELDFHLGPVGGFIGEARRTRDYWAGSFLLARLAGEAMAAAQHAGGSILLPVVERDLGKGRKWREPMFGAIVDAHAKKPIAEPPFLGTLTNHFKASFRNEAKAEAGGKAAAQALRARWKAIADAVRERVLDDFAFAESAADGARKVWDRQIGGAAAAPFWEIYWVVSPPAGRGAGGAEEDSVLDRRKLSRLSADALVAAPESGNFCTMLPGLVDVSGLERRVDCDAFREFWKAARAHLNGKRYRRGDLDEAACLDLRPNESLSAPAMVKRLFSLLIAVAPEAIKSAVGWIPDVCSATSLDYTPGTFQWLRQFLARSAVPAEAPEAEREKPAIELEQQSAVFWPSTSYIAAAHWIARVQRCRPSLAMEFAEAIRGVGLQYALAEQSLWLRAVHEPFSVAPLAFVDGAMFHENRLKLAQARDPTAQRRAIEILRKIQQEPLAATPLGAAGGSSRAVPRIGPPPSYYAIVRADGDRVGHALGPQNPATRQAVSGLFNDFAEMLRGRRNAGSRDDRLGAVAKHNGIILYAGADEAMALAPSEDGFDIAEAMHAAFERAKTKAVAAAGKLKVDGAKANAGVVGSLTLSVAVLYAHIRAPLRWAIAESATLLDDVAKKACGRDALALGILELEGLRSPWAAPWGQPPIGAFRALLAEAAGGRGFLWSNEFYHRLTGRLAALVVPETPGGFADAAKFVAKAAPGTPNSVDACLAHGLLRRIVADRLGGAAHDADRLTGLLIDLMTLCFQQPKAPPGSKPDHYPGPLYAAPLDILRLVGGNWRKDAAATGGAGGAEKAA